jgi:hypothetical protein
LNGLRIMLSIGVLLLVFGSAGLCTPVGEAKTVADGAVVIVNGSITLLEPTECYIESTNRSSGIWVRAGTTGFAVADLVSACGTLGTADGERVIQGATLTAAGAPNSIRALAMRGSWVGGYDQLGGASLQDYVAYKLPIGGTAWQWQATGGASNTGMLVKTWGTVNAVYYSPATDAHWFYIDDGSGVVSDYGDTGIIVYSDADVGQGDFVTVTGISSTEVSFDSSARLVRSMWPRSAADVAIVKKAQPPIEAGPFSDEFDQPVLDERWCVLGDRSLISLTSNPGYAAISTSSVVGGPYLLQLCTGDWDMEAKVVDPALTSNFRFQVGLKGSIPDIQGMGPLSIWSLLRSTTTTPPTADLWLASHQLPALQGGTYWLKARMRRPIVYASASADGISYTAEYLLSDARVASYPFITFYPSSSPSSVPFTLLLDYVRYTPVGP